MPTNIDSLQIEISAKAQSANDAIDRLASKLDRLSASLGKINGNNLTQLASGIEKLSNAMQAISGVKTTDFTRLAKQIEKLGSIDGEKLRTVASGLEPVANTVHLFSNANFDNKNLTGFINSITRLSNSNITNLASVDFSKLGTSIYNLTTQLSKAPAIDRSVISLTSAIGTLAGAGANISVAASELGRLGSEMHSFIQTMSNAPIVANETITFAQAIGTLGNAGTRIESVTSNLGNLAVQLKDFMQTMSTAPMVSQNVIQMINSLTNLASQGGRVSSASQKMVNGLNKTSNAMNRAKNSSKGLASAFGRFYATWFLVIRGIGKLKDAIEGTAEYIEAYNYFNVSFGKIASEWSWQWEKYGEQIGADTAEAYAESFTKRMNESLGKLSGLQVEIDVEGKGLLSETGVKNLGLNIQEITQYSSQLASITNSVGQTGEVSLAAANSFTKLAGDISSLFNIDFNSAAQNLQSGLIGQSRALYKYGIDITNATLQTYAYNLGLGKSVSEMTQAEKMQLRMIAILDQSRVSWGDLANTINSPSNLIRQLTNNLKEAGMVLGQLFIPVMQKVLPVINGVTIAIKRLLVNLASLFGIEIDFDAFGEGYTDMEDSIDDITDAYEDAANAAKEFKNQILGFDEITKLNEDTASSSGTSISGGDIDLTDEILKATEEYEKVWQEAFDKMENASLAFADRFEKILEPVRKIFEDLAIGDFLSVGEDVSNLVVGINEFLAKAIASVNWSKVGENFGKFLAGIDWLEIFASLANVVRTAFDAAWDFWFASLSEAPFTTALLTAIALWKFTGIGTALVGGINKALGTALPAGGFSVKSALKVVFQLTLAFAIADMIGTELAKLLDDSLEDILGDDTVFGYIFKNGISEGLSDLKTAFDDILLEIGGNVPTRISEFTQKINEEISRIKTNRVQIDVDISGIENAYDKIQKVANKYYELSQQSALSQDDLDKLADYKKQLEQFGIDVSGYIDPETQAWIGAREALDNLIAAQRDHLKVLAYQDAVVEAEKDLIALGNDVEKAQDAIWSNATYSEIADQIDQLVEAGYSLDDALSSVSRIVSIDTGKGYSKSDIKAVEKLYKSLKNVTEEYNNQTNYVNRLYTEIDILNGNVVESNEIIGSGITQLENIEDVIGDISKTADKTTDNIKSDFSSAAALVTKKAKEAAQNTNTALSTIKSKDIEVNTNKAQDSVNSFADTANDTLQLGIYPADITATTSSATSAISSLVTTGNKALATIKNPNITATTSSASSAITSLVTAGNNALSKISSPKISVDTSTATTQVTNLAEKIKEIFEKTKLSLVIDKIKTVGELGASVGSAVLNAIKNLSISADTGSFPAISVPTYTIPQYATGKYNVPEDGWFRASKGEFFGQFDDGTSYIANNSQIQAGITQGVEEAAYRGFVRAMSEMGGTQTNVNVTLEGDTKRLFRAVQRQADNYTMQTRKGAFKS